MDLLLLTMDSLVKKNKKTGALTLANKEKQTVEKLKMAIDAFKKIRDDLRDGDPGSGEGAGDNSPKGRRMQGVVETNIRKDGLTITVWPQK